jgi:hypothetical protein
MKRIWLMVLVGCGLILTCDKDKEPPIDEFPCISIQITPNPTNVGIRVTFRVICDDLDEGELEYLWKATGGEFLDGIVNNHTVQWSSNIAGTFDITITVSDADTSVTGNASVVVLDPAGVN